jgi:hypothetical protein
MKPSRFLTLLCLLTIAFAVLVSPVFAQGPVIDIKDCFSEILVDKTHIQTSTELKYALQEEWSQELYEAAKAGGKLNLIIDDVPIGASYDQASEKVNKEKYKRAEDLNYSDNRSLYRASLNQQAGQIINHCLDSASRGQFGLSYVPWVHTEDPTLVTLQFFWHWPDESVEIMTLRVDNATVEDDSKSHPNKLFGWTVRHPISYDVIDANQSRSVTLKRARPDDDITIVVQTKPDLAIHPITIVGEPKPRKCTPVEVKQDEFGKVFTKNFGPVDTSTLTAHDANGREIPLGNGRKWIWDVDMAQYLSNDDTLTGVDCSKYGVPGDYMDLLGANPPWNSVAPGFVEGHTARCIGWWQNPSRHVTMAVHYSKFGYSCPAYEWTFKNNRWQASDTPVQAAQKNP